MKNQTFSKPDAADRAESRSMREEAEKIWDYVTSVKSVRKRDGRIEDFHTQKLEASIQNAFGSGGMKDGMTLRRITANAISRLVKKFNGHATPTTDEIREVIVMTLIDGNLSHVAKKYIAERLDAHHQNTTPVYGKGVRFNRLFSKNGMHPYDEILWEKRDAVITNADGKVVFEQRGVEVPTTYSQTATNILVSKYFRGRLGTPERETSVRQMVDRVAQTIANFGRNGAYFLTEDDAQTFEDELTSILVNQRAAFNSPVWFNVGVNPKPQCSACFINSVHDDMRSILNLAVTEGMLFKYGSGAGSNLSRLRSAKEQLGSSSGFSSGPVSFMKGLDAFAGVIKSGGKTRRAAKMVILDIDHPDILEFTWCKAKEEKKAHTLIDAGYDGSLDGEAYGSIFFQNANNSVRVTDEFMQAVDEDGEFWTKFVLSKEPCERFKARELMRQIAQAAWECGDPGIQYDTTINDWHTSINTDRIYSSNPCSEYMFLNDSACNLASVNLMKCRDENGNFDTAAYEHICRVMITAQEIVVDNSSYPTPAIEQNSWDYRPLGLGYANLGSLLMSMGVAYDSDKGRNIASGLTSILSGAAYEQSAKIAEKLGAFRGYARNEQPMLRVMRKHRDAAYRIDTNGVPQNIVEEARSAWDRALAIGERYGYRNSQISVLAPTGTIGFLMDCQTTGVEPAIALVSYKWLVGGGMMKLVNETVPEALHALNYTEVQIKDILEFIDKNDTIEGAPHLEEAHLPIFDCAFKPANGKRSIHHMGHVKMMAAVQPFISGAISKTVNMPPESTVEEVMETYLQGWKLGLKAIAIYRDGCKRSQPLTTRKEEITKATEAKTVATASVSPSVEATTTGEVFTARRRRLPDERKAITHKFQIGAHEGFITAGLYEDGTPGEVFIVMNKEGSTLSGLMDSFATAISIGLQYGVPMKTLVNKFAHVRFEPSGFTPNPHIRMAKSIVDYVFRWLALKFLSSEDRQSLGLKVEEPSIHLAGTPEDAAVKEFMKEDARQATLLEPSEDKGLLSHLTATINNNADAPACGSCGAIMVRNAACYKCLNCGGTSGCS